MFAVLFQINKYYYLKNSNIKGQMDVFENTNVMIKHNDKRCLSNFDAHINQRAPR